MALVFPNVGERLGIGYFVNKYAPENLVLRLFTNNITPAETDTAGTYTEAAGFGYGAITLAGASWAAPTEGDPTTTTYAMQTFTFTGALGNVYGLFYTRLTGGELMAAERFSDAPYNIQNNGDKIEIDPSMSGS